MTDALTRRALQIALHERSIYRTMSLAALDQLTEALGTLERQRQQIAEMREERERFARSVFDV